MKVASVKVYKASTPLTVPTGPKKGRKNSISKQKEIEICRNCTKPMEKCKGNCFE